ncbi:hypothetical protein AVEN_90685-1 [Araneus ventricosus]|uniref:Uncharacterized protein n=1 Tax=Araneus ventricosus TaxID=182803 RepID=A0A4Y2PH25_ARAVE|nr:hypothetical protein AVEN_90685-1 [Araneus ventricosus]
MIKLFYSLKADFDLHIHQPCDISSALGKILKDIEKLKFLNETWTPDGGFQFLYQTEGKQQRKFNQEWLDQYKLLAYSAKFNGGFCKMCVLFASFGAEKGVM